VTATVTPPASRGADGTRTARAIVALPAQVKLAGALAFVLGVVATPRTAVPAFVLDAVAVGVVVALAGLRARRVMRRLLIEAPFVAFALLLPFVARGPQVAVGPLSLAVDGLWAAWGILAKGTLGVSVAVVLAATTPTADLLAGARRLHVPVALTAIAGFMVRYGEVLVGELERLRIARISRGDDPRWLWQAKAVVATAGTLFIRAFERGERVHLAMAARGFDGTWPALGPLRARPGEWVAVLAVAAIPAAGAAVALIGMA